jgi:hypothetical protein
MLQALNGFDIVLEIVLEIAGKAVNVPCMLLVTTLGCFGDVLH